MRAIRVCIVIFLVLCIISLLLTALLFFVRENEKEKRIALEGQVAQLNVTITGLNTKVSELKSENKALDQEVEEQKGLVDSYKLKLRQQKKVVTEKTQKLDEAERELESLRDDFSSYKLSSGKMIEDFRTQNTSLLERISRLESPTEESPSPMLAYDTTPTSYDYDTYESPYATGSVDLEPVVVHADTAIRGKVEVVNRNFNFVVSNIGRSDGISIGDTLTVKRDGVYVASVRVEKLYENLSASAIDHETVDNPIQEGDEVEFG